jgi:hypothetical protein
MPGSGVCKWFVWGDCFCGARAGAIGAGRACMADCNPPYTCGGTFRFGGIFDGTFPKKGSNLAL